MDAFNSKEFYGHSLSDDPKLRTTARNYEFKYNCSDHLEKVITRVKMEREKKRRSELLATNCIPPGVKKLCAPYSRKSARSFKTSSVETQIGKSSSTIVTVMTDAEIESMITQALQSNTHLPISNIMSQEETQTAAIESKSEDKPQIEIKIPKCSVEVQSALQPQWVEIKPTEKASASIMNIASSFNTELNTESLDDSAFNLASEDLTNFEILIDDRQNEDILSCTSNISEDYIIRNEDSPHQREIQSPLLSPLSFGIESALNDCERAEMERVLSKVLPHVPEMEFGNICSQDSEKSDEKQGDAYDESDASSEFEQNFQPIVRINQLECRPKQLSHSNAAKEETTKSTAITDRSPITDRTSSSKQKSSSRPMDKIMHKQVEFLKQEKIRIFSKMTSIQEQIIENLDTLRLHLVELSLPNGQTERKLRERNAFEFSVRFSRNYLFPLGRMIDELRLSPNEDYRSATTNEPCVKVCGIYGLLNQALQCYHKQLRHFFIDSIPKKLDVLLKLIFDATTICLRKKIFDKRDSLIQCLQTRCNSFLEFVLLFAEQKTAREVDIPLKSGRKEPFKLTKTSSKWDLTMNLNNLNMYEPKLVAKKPKKRSHKKSMSAYSSREKLKEPVKLKEPIKLKEQQQIKVKEPTKPKEPTKSIEQNKHSVKTRDSIALPAPDPVDTQVRKINYAESVQLINTVIEEQPDSELTKTVIETLQDITKDEVHQMLGPLVLSLGSILKNQDNPQTVESALGVLNLQLLEKCKQLKIDAAATENSTQNGNTYQKEVTKKGAEFSKGERRKENRLKRRRTPKTRTTITTNNVYKSSTEPTETKNSPGGRIDSTCDKQSLSNTDDKNHSTKHKSRSVVVHREVFLSPRVTPPVTAAAKKPTPAPAAIQTGIPSLSLVDVASLGQLNTVMTPSPRPSGTPQQRMTSRRVEQSTSLPMIVPIADKFSPECQWIGDGGYPRRYPTEIISQPKLRDDVVDAYNKEPEDNEEYPPSAPPPKKDEAATSGSGQMEQLKYSSNALYTFVKYDEDALISPVQCDVNENVPDEECFTESSTRLLPFSPKLSQNPSYQSTDSNVNLSSPQLNEERCNEEDITELLEKRESFIEQCKHDPLYANSQFPQPWKVLSKISRNIAGEIVENFGNNLSFGEESYVRDFINMEMQT